MAALCWNRLLLNVPEALLFDLGGVLIDVDFDLAISAWQPYSSLPFNELKARFKQDCAYEQHERGEISAEQYFDYLAVCLQLNANSKEIQRGWNAIFKGEILETRRRIEQIRSVIPCYAFSNTNASHMAQWSDLYPDLNQVFERIFTSHELGLRKPELPAFEAVCRLMEKPAEQVVFFDDLIANVEAARKAGMQAFLVNSPADIDSALTRHGLLS